MKGIQKVEKFKRFAYVLFPPPQEMQIFEILDEMRDALVEKDRKSCELHENGHSELI